MREIQYKDFSLKTHGINLGLDKASVCQFEVTFSCGLHCRHCYTDCFNRPDMRRRELSTDGVISVLDRVKRAGILWLCLTGGDPIARADFADIYAYAKDEGFIVTVFTSGYSVTRDIVRLFQDRPPFVVEITLNSVSSGSYEKISRVKSSFSKVMKGIEDIRMAGIPLKIKTQVTTDNLDEIPKIKNFVESLGMKFIPNHIIYPSLEGDIDPCKLRIRPIDVVGLYGLDKARRKIVPGESADKSRRLFPCAIESGDGINIDPYGNMFLCTLIREPRMNILDTDIEEARAVLLSRVRDANFSGGSRCGDCSSKKSCSWCPGKAYAERGSAEEPIDYYCELSAAMEGKDR